MNNTIEVMEKHYEMLIAQARQQDDFNLAISYLQLATKTKLKLEIAKIIADVEMDIA